jgi:MFS family permease
MWLFRNEQLKDTPNEVLNWRLWYGIFVFGLMGAARGLDEGLIGTTVTQFSFIAKYGLEDEALTEHEQANLVSNITSMVQLGSILGALIGFYLTDKLGRLKATMELCFLWVLGIAIFMASAPTGNIGMVYAGRFIAGVGVGQTTVVAPTYLAEISPRAIRGFSVCMFSGAVYLGIMLYVILALFPKNYSDGITCAGRISLRGAVLSTFPTPTRPNGSSRTACT